MALDPALTDAVRKATADSGQPDAVASRVLAWLTRLSDGELSRDTNAQFYNETRQVMKIEGASDAD